MRAQSSLLGGCHASPCWSRGGSAYDDDEGLWQCFGMAWFGLKRELPPRSAAAALQREIPSQAPPSTPGHARLTRVVVLCVYRDYPYPWGDPLRNFHPGHSYAFRWPYSEPPHIGQWVIVGGINRPSHAVVGAIGPNDYVRENGFESLEMVQRAISLAESKQVHDELHRAEMAAWMTWLNMARHAAGLTVTEPVAITPPDGFDTLPPIEGDGDAASGDTFGGIWWRAYKKSEELDRDPEEVETFGHIARHWYRVRDQAMKAEKLAMPSRVVESIGLGSVVRSVEDRSSADVEAMRLAGVQLWDWLAYARVLASHGRDDEALELVNSLITAAEQESKYSGLGPALVYTERAAIIYRKRRDYAAEIAVIERWDRACPPDKRGRGAAQERLANRLTKARVLARKQGE